jgi:hypothetical protein
MTRVLAGISIIALRSSVASGQSTKPAFDIVDVHKSAPNTAFRPVLLLQTHLALANQWASKLKEATRGQQ